MIVHGKRPPKAASEWAIAFDHQRKAPKAGSSGADLMREAPGVYISQHSGEGKAHQIFLRGFDAVHGQDIEIHVGGIPVNEVSNIHGQGYADLHFLIPEVVRRMRVIEGVYDPRQGDFAVAGSIDFDLGLEQRGLFGRVSIGSFALARGMVAWAPEGQARETFVAAEFARADGFGPSRAWMRGSVMGQALLSVSARTKLRILASAYAGRFDSAGVVRLDDYEAGVMGHLDSYQGGQGGGSARHQLLLEYRYRGDRARAALSSYVVYRDLRLRHNFTGFTIEPQGKVAQDGANEPQGDTIQQNNEALTIGGRGSYRRELDLFDRTHAIEVGTIWRHDRIAQDQSRLRTVDGAPWLDQVEAKLRLTTLGVYGDVDLSLHPRVNLRFACRVDAAYYQIDDLLHAETSQASREAFGFFFGPRATLELKIIDSLSLYASYGRGYRSPQALSLGQAEQAPFTLVDSAEIGGRVDLGRPLKATLVGYATRVGNDLLFDHVTGQSLVIGSVVRGGLALTIESRPLSWLSAVASVTWVRAVTEADGAVVPYAPTLVARVDLDAQRRVGLLWNRPVEVFGGLGLTALGPRPLPYDERSKSVVLLDLSAGLRWGPATLSLEIFNLADARWRDGEFVYASNFDAKGAPSMVPSRHFTAGRPLTAQGTLTLNF
jgi:outer membrane receptor protein involved in Fe transport